MAALRALVCGCSKAGFEIAQTFVELFGIKRFCRRADLQSKTAYFGKAITRTDSFAVVRNHPHGGVIQRSQGSFQFLQVTPAIGKKDRAAGFDARRDSLARGGG